MKSDWSAAVSAIGSITLDLAAHIAEIWAADRADIARCLVVESLDPREGGEMRYLHFGFLALVLLLAAACSDDTPTEGPVTIVAHVDFDDRPVIGTFEVTDGADVLQCSSGTFEDGRVNNATHLRVFACESGPNQGTFTATFTVNDVPTGGDANGSWSVAEGADDFVGLQGGGEWISVKTGDLPQSVETWTGDINYTS
jgi:hypothetical protein